MKRTSVGPAALAVSASLCIFLAAIVRAPAGFRTHPLRSDAFPMPADERFAKVEALVSSGLAQRNIPSVSIAVARRGRVIWERSFGWADREKQVKASPDTVYSLASATKPMTATALLVLVRAGKVDLDAPVERYIGPDQLTVYEGLAKDVTLRRLLHHTAGLPQHFNYFYADEPDRPRPLEETVRRFAIIVRPPGEEFCYANLGYAILGHVVARVSRRPLADFMKEEVFGPLGMTGAVFEPDPDRRKNLAVPYDNQGGSLPFHWSDTPGAAHAYASVHDLIRFGMFHLKDHLGDQPPILDDGTIVRMQTEKDGAVHKGNGNESYGLGWFFKETAGGVRTVWHEGGWTGASAMLKLVPAEDLAVAVLINEFDTEFINEVTEETIRAMVPGYAAPKSPVADRSAAPAPPSFDLPAGTYSGGIRTLERTIPLLLEKTAGGELRARLGDPASTSRPVREVPAFVPRAPGQLLVFFPGPLGAGDAVRHPHSVVLDLRWAGDELVGTASAWAPGGQGNKGTDDPRMHFVLPYRVSLKRTGLPPAPSAAPPGPAPKSRLFDGAGIFALNVISSRH